MTLTLELTKHLYNKDEVIYSLITSLLTKRDLNECYYWIFELYYSEIDIFTIIWKIYLDFYFTLNPVLERHIRKKHSLWIQSPNNKHIAFIIKNLFNSKICYNVFILTQYATICEYPTHIYKGRKPKWCTKYPIEFHNWLRSIDKNLFENIVYYTKHILNIKSSREVFEILVQYFAHKMEVEVDDGVFEFINVRMDGHDMHYILAMIMHLKLDKDHFTDKNIFTLPSKNDLQWIKDTQEYDIVSHKILSQKRLYEIDDNIGWFNLARQNVSSMLDTLRFQWEYYAFNTPIWNKRMNKFNATINHKTKKIDFLNDEDLELFYENFGLEPDEQSLNVQNMSTKDIICKENMFSALSINPIIVMPFDFKFLY